MEVRELLEYLSQFDGEEEIQIGVPATDSDSGEEYIALFDELDVEKVEDNVIIFKDDAEEEEVEEDAEEDI